VLDKRFGIRRLSWLSSVHDLRRTLPSTAISHSIVPSSHLCYRADAISHFPVILPSPSASTFDNTFHIINDVSSVRKGKV
jgi:hypothetical protein